MAIQRKVTRAMRVELKFLQALASRQPKDDRILKPLGDLFTACGKYEEGLHVDQQLSGLCPRDPMVWYNLGCSFALLNRKEDACQALERAVTLGYSDADWMGQDEDLAGLKEDPAFLGLIKKAKGDEP
jgi:predicted Zn-dependent protease